MNKSGIVQSAAVILALLIGIFIVSCGGGGGTPPDTTNPDVPVLSGDSGVQPNATVGGTVTLKATATDNSGTVAKVEFFVASEPMLACADAVAKPSGSVFQCTWNTTNVANGAHELTIRAYDRANNSTSSAPIPFTVFNPQLVVTLAGNGSGSVSSLDGAINCGSQCTATYPPDTVVTLTATPDSGSRFAGWSGDCSGSSPSVQVTMNASKTCTATFVRQYTVTVQKSGTGNGTVTSSPTGINCGPTCSASFDEGTMLTLTAVADSGSVFAGWSGPCSGTGSCQFTVNANTTVGAVFNASQVTITISKTGSGVVTSSPSGIVCGRTCQMTVNSGTSVTLMAQPGPGQTFNGWSGGGCSGTGQCVISPTTDVTISAQFSNTISYATDIQSIWDTYCTGCHGNNDQLTLTRENSYPELLNENPTQSCRSKRVLPDDPDGSVLWHKLQFDGVCGQGMPPGGQLNQTLREKILAWILAGAPNN